MACDIIGDFHFSVAFTPSMNAPSSSSVQRPAATFSVSQIVSLSAICRFLSKTSGSMHSRTYWRGVLLVSPNQRLILPLEYDDAGARIIIAFRSVFEEFREYKWVDRSSPRFS